MSSLVREGEILAGKYKVERVLAQGGMGVVVAAIHQQLDQRVALKFMLPKDAPTEADFGRFMREAKAAVRLRSEHVAKVLDVGTVETGSPYIVMEYLDGRDLETILDEAGPLPVSLAVEYVLQACEAVAEAHALGIVHRDLKPANLFLTTRTDGSPCVKVLDFGISKLLESTEPVKALTSTNAIMGTPVYMAPEQIRSSKGVDRRSDVWAFGMILYQLLTGRTAFIRETLLELCSAILIEQPTSPHELRAEIPPELSSVILKALAKEPEGRFGTLAELADALSPFCESGLASASRVSRVLGLTSSPNLSEQLSQPRLEAVAQTAGEGALAQTAAAPTPTPHSERSASVDSLVRAPEISSSSASDVEARGSFAPTPRFARWKIGVAAAGLVAGALLLGLLVMLASPDPKPIAPAASTPAVSAASAVPLAAASAGPLESAPPPASASPTTAGSSASSVDAVAHPPTPSASIRANPRPIAPPAPRSSAIRVSPAASSPKVDKPDSLDAFGPRK
ncbi:MAG: serine/threonine protein kinase [Deltaproteobacteria bacterium]|nr:serine/threonine protein kinase [Deltaproteobacteria bacterium]